MPKMSDTVSKIQAKLVYDGGDDLKIPEEMGTPAPNQMQGSVLMRVAELASRICYDSLGRGRSSADLHAHLKEVLNLSVYEHTPVVVRVSDAGNYGVVLANRPGVWFRPVEPRDVQLPGAAGVGSVDTFLGACQRGLGSHREIHL